MCVCVCVCMCALKGQGRSESPESLQHLPVEFAYPMEQREVGGKRDNQVEGG